MIEKTKDLTNIKALDIMGSNPLFIESGTLASKAMQIVKENNITQIIVLDKDGFYSGMIHLHDLIKEGISEE